MSKSGQISNRTRRRHPLEFKQEALALAARVGVRKAASQLGLAESQLYGWRAKVWGEQSQGEREQHLATENARLKRALSEAQEEAAILKKAAVYFAKGSR